MDNLVCFCSDSKFNTRDVAWGRLVQNLILDPQFWTRILRLFHEAFLPAALGSTSQDDVLMKNWDRGEGIESDTLVSNYLYLC